MATTGSYTDLSNKPTIPSAQIPSDWNQTTTTALDYIKNKPTLFSGAYADLSDKPTIPLAQIQSDWNQTTTTALDYIKNKPTLFDGSWGSLSGTPNIPGFIAYTKASDFSSLSIGSDWYADSTTPYWHTVLHFSANDGRAGYVYSAISDDQTGGGWINYAVPSGAKTAVISHLNWSNCRYFDVYGRKTNGTYMFILRHNAIQTVRNNANGYEHDGVCLITVPGVDLYDTLRIQLVKGRAHLMGIGWSSEDRHVNSMTGTGQIHADNVYGAVASATSATSASSATNATNLSGGGTVNASSMNLFGRATVWGSYNTGGGQNRFPGLEGTDNANGRAQIVLNSAYSDHIIASSQYNGNHGSTLTFCTFNPDNSYNYRKWVVNQQNWGGDAAGSGGYGDRLMFGWTDSEQSNPHGVIGTDGGTLCLDGRNRRVGINGVRSPAFTLDVNGIRRDNNPFWCVSKQGLGNYNGQQQFNTNEQMRNCGTNVLGWQYYGSQGWVYNGNWYTVQPYASGYYHLTFHAFADYTDSGGGGVYFTVNGGKRGARIYSDKAYGQYQAGFCLSIITYLNANDQVGVYSDHTLHGNDNCSFSGYMISG